MRIVAGTRKGHPIVAPKGRLTRPTADRVREAVFSAIASRLGGEFDRASVLDAFAGTGALGLEALSRGAARATFVEMDSGAAHVLRANVAALGLAEQSTLMTSDVFKVARRGALPGAPFALLFLDPPYRIDEAKVRGLIEALSAGGAIAPGALVVWEHDVASSISWPQCIIGESEKRYGSTSVSIGSYAKGEGA
jgi:16S rRNA (guanine966-N2)-methyltransferase